MADNNIWYNIKKDELYLILASMGVRKWFGFGISSVSVTYGEVSRLIGDLWQKDIIFLDGKKMKVRDEYKPIFGVAARADRIVVAARGSGDRAVYISYFSDDIAVIMTSSRTDSETVLMRYLPLSKWAGAIINECIDYDTISQFTGDANEKDPCSTLSPETVPAAALSEENDVISVFDSLNDDADMIRERLVLREKGVRQYITLETAGTGEVRKMHGGLVQVKEIIGNWAKGTKICL